MLLTLLIVLGLGADEAQAGAAYKEALEAVRQGRYEEAVQRLQDAIRNEPRETDKLQYRDKEGRHKDPYYPHYVWSQARALQARSEKALPRRRELLREAVTHLELTQHPGAAAMLDAVKADLAALEKEAAPAVPDAALVALLRRIDELRDQEQFVAALRLVATEKPVLDRHPADRTKALETIEAQRNTVLARYSKIADFALETVAAASPLEKPDSIPLLLQPALLPASLTESPDARFAWLRQFLAVWQEQLPTIRTLAAADSASISRCARAFEKAAARGLESGSFAGFRASMNVAQAIRGAAIAVPDDVRLGPVLADAEEALVDCDKILAAQPARKEIDAYRSGVLRPYARRLKEAREHLLERTRLREAIVRWLRGVDEVLENAATMANPEALWTIVKEAAALEDRANWNDAPAGLRARTLFARGVLEITAGILDGDSLPGVLERAAPRVKAARTLDPSAEASWKERLSPKVKAGIEQLDR